MTRLSQGTAVVAACLALLSPAPAHAAGEPAFGCKKVHHGKATVPPSQGGRPPVLIGDSTVLLPIPNLSAVGITVNGRGCRGFREGTRVAAKMKAKHHLPHLVLMNDYGNGGVNPRLIKGALQVLGPKRVLGLVTAYDADTGHPPAPDTDVLFKARRRHPHRIVVLDWVSFSLPHHTVEPTPGAWFLPDLFHPDYTGADAFARFLAQSLWLAPKGRFP
jgi:hypothetical protein